MGRVVPADKRRPLSLAWRLLSGGSAEARSAVLMALAGAALTPLDLALTVSERRYVVRAEKQDHPLVFVVGPPRSGTTLLAQYLINRLDVCYINNLTALFPRAPLTANRLFGRWAPLSKGSYTAYYGKSTRLAGANDGLHIWDRWLGKRREEVPRKLAESAEHSLLRFFDALRQHYDRPVVNKVNRLNTCAHLVAAVLDNCHFICLQRDPLFLAQSLYLARQEIVGDMNTPYGTAHDNRVVQDPVEDVCRQVLFHERCAIAQQKRLGQDRFRIVSYEEFCDRPGDLVSALVTDIEGLRLQVDVAAGRDRFDVSKRSRLPAGVLAEMRAHLDSLGAGGVNCLEF